jgi:hypothetical protein
MVKGTLSLGKIDGKRFPEIAVIMRESGATVELFRLRLVEDLQRCHLL